MKVDAGLFICIIGFICCCAYLDKDKHSKIYWMEARFR